MDLLDYLVTSKARKGLLQALLGRGMSGSVSELARASGVRPSTAEHEVARMRALGLVSLERVGRAKVVRTNLRSAAARRLKGLLATSRPGSGPRTTHHRLRAALAHYGAPLFVPAHVEVENFPALEVALAEGLRAAHEDAALAGNLPVVLWRHRRELNLPELVRLATRKGEARALGFFLELTDELAGERFFAAVAQGLSDRRVRRMRNFFTADGSFRPYERELALANSPEVAKRRHFLMNMSMDSFAAYFRKGTKPDVRLSPRV